jgi:hypothetical protein
MRTNRLITLCCAALLGGSAPLPALAQTGRIAHFSHGGSAATLAAEEAAADNFGDPMPYFAPDSVRYLSGKMAVAYGRWQFAHRPASTTDTIRFPEEYSRRQAAVYARQLYARAKLIGFDSVSSPGKISPLPKPLPPDKRKKKAAGATSPASSGLRLGSLVVALAAVGWLLGGKKPAAQPSER